MATDRAWDQAWPDGRYIQAAIFFSRWLLAPFLVGLLLCLLVLMYRFFADLFELGFRCDELARSRHRRAQHGRSGADRQSRPHRDLFRLRKLHPQDRCGGSSRLAGGPHPIDFGELKQKLLGSIAGIAAVDALAWYLDLERAADTSKLSWADRVPARSPLSCSCSPSPSGWRGGLPAGSDARPCRKSRPRGRRAESDLLPQRRSGGEGLLTIPSVNRCSTFVEWDRITRMRVIRSLMLGVCGDRRSRLPAAAGEARPNGGSGHAGIDNVVYGRARLPRRPAPADRRPMPGRPA